MKKPINEWPRRPGGAPVTGRNISGTLSPSQVDKYVNIAVNGGQQIVLREISNAANKSQAVRLVDYITRQGTLPAIDAEGFSQNAPTWLNTLDMWAASFRPIPPHAEGRTPRNVGHFMLSAPSGIDPNTLHAATREWLKTQFGGQYDYLSVLHDDTDNPHVHIVINRNHLLLRNRALQMRTNEIDEWRQSAAKICRAHGLAVDASLRVERAVTKYNVPQAIHHMIKRGEKPDERVRAFIASGDMTEKQKGYLARILREAERFDLVRELYVNQPDADERVVAAIDAHKDQLNRLIPTQSKRTLKVDS